MARVKISELRKQIEDLEVVQTRLQDHILSLCTKIEQQDRREQSYKNLEKQYEHVKGVLENIEQIIHKFPPQMRLPSHQLTAVDKVSPHVHLAHILGFIHAQEHNDTKNQVSMTTPQFPSGCFSLDQES